MKFSFSLLLSLAFAVNTFAQVDATIDLNGTSRSYTYYVPANLPANQAVPLVFVLHGTTQTGNGIMDISNFNELADANQFVVVYPDGVGNAWNVGIGAAGSDADDLGFIELLVETFTNNYNIDSSRLYSCGFSAGGYMSYRLACESSFCFAAVGSVGGTMNESIVSACNPLFSSSVICIHGTSDLVVSYDGSAIAGNSVPQVLQFWSTELGCDAVPSIENLPNISFIDFSSVERHTYLNCSGELDLIHLKVIGGGHQWPGTDALLGGIGVVNQDINASAEIWNFFSSKSCDINTSIVDVEISESRLYPNPASDVLYYTGNQNTNFQMINYQGQLVLEGKYQGSIDLGALESGIYFFITHDGKREKIIITH